MRALSQNHKIAQPRARLAAIRRACASGCLNFPPGADRVATSSVALDLANRVHGRDRLAGLLWWVCESLALGTGMVHALRRHAAGRRAGHGLRNLRHALHRHGRGKIPAGAICRSAGALHGMTLSTMEVVLVVVVLALRLAASCSMYAGGAWTHRR